MSTREVSRKFCDLESSTSDPLLVLTHPHRNYDTDLTSASFSQQLIDRGKPERTVILRTDDPLMVVPPEGVITAISQEGEIAGSLLEKLRSNDRITLLGGYALQCHLKSFEAIGKYVFRNALKNVAVTIPYDGCFVSHVEFESPGTPRRSGPAGDRMQILERPIQTGNSYTLAEVGRFHYDLTPHSERGHVVMLRGADGLPVPATANERDTTLFQIYFKQYLYALRKVPSLTRFAVSYGDQAITITLNPDAKRQEVYRAAILNENHLDRYSVLEPQLLKQYVSQSRIDAPTFLRNYFTRLEEQFEELGLQQLRQYQKLYSDHGLTTVAAKFEPPIAERELMLAIGRNDLRSIEQVMDRSPAVASKIEMMELVKDHIRPGTVVAVCNRVSSELQERLWFLSALRGRDDVLRAIRPLMRAVDVGCSDDSSPLLVSHQFGKFKAFRYLLSLGADPFRRTTDLFGGLLEETAANHPSSALQRLMRLVSFPYDRKERAFRLLVQLCREVDGEAPKLSLLGREMGEDALRFAEERGYRETVKAIRHQKAGRPK